MLLDSVDGVEFSLDLEGWKREKNSVSQSSSGMILIIAQLRRTRESSSEEKSES